MIKKANIRLNNWIRYLARYHNKQPILRTLETTNFRGAEGIEEYYIEKYKKNNLLNLTKRSCPHTETDKPIKIYALICPAWKKVKYIGRAINTKKRLADHIYGEIDTTIKPDIYSYSLMHYYSKQLNITIPECLKIILKHSIPEEIKDQVTKYY